MREKKGEGKEKLRRRGREGGIGWMEMRERERNTYPFI